MKKRDIANSPVHCFRLFVLKLGAYESESIALNLNLGVFDAFDNNSRETDVITEVSVLPVGCCRSIY